MIHDEIADRLTNAEEVVRLDALKKVHMNMYACSYDSDTLW